MGREAHTVENSLPPLYTFIDEGGDFNFSPTGSKYFTITSVTASRPFPLEEELAALRFDLLESGLNLEYFHASEDRQQTRDRVFALIQKDLRRLRVDSIIVEKRKTGPSLREMDQFYPRMLGYLLRYVANGVDWNHWSELVVITDRIPHNRKRSAIEKAVKTALAAVLPANVRFRVLHHDSKSTYLLQVADYFNWAIFRAWTSRDTRSLDLVRGAIMSQFDIFWYGDRIWY